MRDFIRTLAGPKVKQDNKDLRPQDRRGQHRDKGGGHHAGLLLQRYLCEAATGEGGNPEEKRAILRAAINAARTDGVRALYRMAFERWSAALPTDPAPVTLQTVGRLIVGLGSENVLETGIRLHHTYGIPIIPGSALKGLAAHYCDQVWGVIDKRFKKPTKPEDEAYRQFLAGKGPKPEGSFHRLLFGTTDDNGCITFHDSWLTWDSPEPLLLDVMTPHHPKWNDVNNPVAPTDFDSPTPVPFLSVSGRFRVAVSWHGPSSDQAKNWTELARSLLCDALTDWGVGGKTTSGYGRLIQVKPSQTPARPTARVERPAPAGRPAAPSGKRDHGTPATVTIIAARPGGFDVQEAGRPPGVLNQGKAPATLPEIGASVEVYVFNDDPRKPQYRWDRPPQQPQRGRGGPPRRR
ncbi:MAG TPA: type III-B CRISPR module RAMP protein Cmr6 [Gemmataceae bacterium]|nr:type III-B CRISPR module RAMP protein Cmr6 [Gemmataceae bacterium]